MKSLLLYILLLAGCSSKEDYFSLELRSNGIVNLSASTPYSTRAVEEAIKGIKALKLQKISPLTCSSIIVVQHNARDIVYIHPDTTEKKIASIEVIDEDVFTPEKLHVGMVLTEAIKRVELDCNSTTTYHICHTPNTQAIHYYFLKSDTKLDKMVLTF